MEPSRTDSTLKTDLLAAVLAERVTGHRELTDQRDQFVREKEALVHEILNLKTQFLSEKMVLIRQMSDLAIDKALDAAKKHDEITNGKFELLRQQSETLTRKEETQLLSKKIDDITRLVYIAIGAIIVIKFILDKI